MFSVLTDFGMLFGNEFIYIYLNIIHKHRHISWHTQYIHTNVFKYLKKKFIFYVLFLLKIPVSCLINDRTTKITLLPNDHYLKLWLKTVKIKEKKVKSFNNKYNKHNTNNKPH